MAVCSAGMMQQESASSRPHAIDATGVSPPPSSGLSLLKRVKEQLRPRVARSKSRGNLLRPNDAQASTSMESDTDEISEDTTTEEASEAVLQQQQQQPPSALDAITASLQQQYQAAADTYYGMRRRAQQANPLRLRVARARQHSSYSRAARLLSELPSSQQQQQMQIQQQTQQQQQAQPSLLRREDRSGLQDQLQPSQQPSLAAETLGQPGVATPGAQPPAGPSLPAVTLVVKMLLQLAAAKVSSTYASQLRRQLLQQVKQTAAAAKAAGLPFSVPATVHQLLPRLRSEVMAACRQQELAAAAAAAAEADTAAASSSGAAPIDADASVDVASGDGDDEQQPSVFAAPCAAAAVETALTTAACEAQLMGLRLSSGPAVMRSVSRPAVDFESLLRAELAAALSADF